MALIQSRFTAPPAGRVRINWPWDERGSKESRPCPAYR